MHRLSPISGDKARGFPYYGQFPHRKLGPGHYELTVPADTPLFSVIGGTVTRVLDGVIRVQYGDVWGVIRGLHTILVKEGDRINRGTHIGFGTGKVVIQRPDMAFLDRDAPFAGRMSRVSGHAVSGPFPQLLNGLRSIVMYKRVSSMPGPRYHPRKGNRHVHSGVDLTAPSGTPVRAGVEGTVLHAAVRGGYGNCIIIDVAGSGYYLLYAHLSRMHVKKGDKVSMTTHIGDVGSTGMSTGPHLHLELRRDPWVAGDAAALTREWLAKYGITREG